MKKHTTIGAMLIFGLAFLTSAGVNAQSTPTKDTETHRLTKTKNQSGERVIYKDGEKIIIKEGESSPYGTSRWETDAQGNKVLVIRRNVEGDSTSLRLIANKNTGEQGEKAIFKNGEKFVIKEGESSPFGTVQVETDEQGNEILIMRRNTEGDTAVRRLHAHKTTHGQGEKVRYKDGKKIILTEGEIHLHEKGEWKTDEKGNMVFVIQKDSGKTLYVYPERNPSTGQGITPENIGKVSEPLILYPNPTPATCNILYHVEKTGTVLLELVNMEGKTINTLLNEQKENGSYTLTIDLSGYSSGTYFIRYSAHNELSVKKILKIE